jgi:RHS repeat-associated protein
MNMRMTNVMKKYILNSVSARGLRHKTAFMLACLLFVLTSMAVFGQNPQSTENKADQTLRSTGRVNPSTLGMEFDLQLGSYPGRGINVPISMSYSSKLWRFDLAGNYPDTNEPSGCSTYYNAKYAENTASGWTSSLAIPYIEYVGHDNPFTIGGFPHNTNAHCGIGPNNDPYYVYRIMVHLPGGETHELRANTGASWNNTFYSTDGSNLKYVEDSTNNTYRLLMPDGSYYDFATGNTVQMNGSTVRKGTQYSDRNGNYISYNSSGVWTDTLGRTFEAPFGLAAPTTPTTEGSPVTYSMPGMTGTYKFQWKNLKGSSAAESGLTDWTQNLKYAGGMYQIYQAPWWAYQASGTTLFQGKVLSTGLFNPVVLTEIELPTGAKYKFTYDIYGRIERIDYPTGGEERFTYSQIKPLSYSAQTNITDQANYGVTHREVYETAGSGTPYEWDYAITENGAGGYKVSTTAPDGTETQRFLHRSDEACVGCEEGGWGFDNALAGMAYEERQFSSTGALLSRKLTHWTKSTIVYDQVYHIDWSPRVDHEENYTYDSSGNGVYSTTKYEYAGDLSSIATPVLANKTIQWDYQTTSGGGSIIPSATPSASPTVSTPVPSPSPARATESIYLVNDSNYASVASYYTAQNITGLVTETRIIDGSGGVKAKIRTEYDQVGPYPLLTDVSSTRWTDPNSNYRGLVTTTKSWSDVTNNFYVQTHTQYDRLGNLRKSWDAKGNLSQIEYSSTYDYAFPTKTTSPIPGGNGSTTAFETTIVYDVNTGLPVSTTDPNGLETRMEYDDPLLRPTKVSRYHNNQPVGGATETSYGAGTSESTRWVKVRSQIDAEKWAEGYTWFDGLGRTYKSQNVDSNGDVFIETLFDAVGRVWKTSNPYRSGDTILWTENFYDTAGRLFKVKTPDNSEVETAYGVATTGSRIGTVETVADQAEKQRRSITNALGQLTRLDEPNDAGELGTISAPNQDTLYAYDTLSNITTVTQGVQTRSFAYDSLSRLKSATNPESGTISYQYDLKGNLTQKSQPRSIGITVAINYTYDALNRVNQRSYSGEAVGYTTPTVTYTYDNLTHARGMLTKVYSSVSSTESLTFDLLGRVTRSKQVTDGVTYGTDEKPMTYAYNLSGAMIEQKYPSGRIVKTVLDSDGALSAVESKKNSTSGPSWGYAQNFTYNAAGAVTSMQFGNGHWESTQFNSRLQPTRIALGKTAGAVDLLKLDYSYGTNANNGNIQSQIITVPTVGITPGFTATQGYTYDSLNRLKDATETVPTNQITWKQSFLYDRYGNRTFDEPNTTTLTKGCGTTPNFTVCAAARKLENPEIQTSDNRIKSDQDGDGVADYTFDYAGNTTKQANGMTFVFDAESKQIEVKNSSSVTLGQYFYDGDGKRVKKVVPNGETTIFVYDASGKMVAEYSTVLNPTPQVSYLTNDHLGSPRINADQNGAVIARHDYHPFGEEITGGARTGTLGYVADDNRKRFTEYERDYESGLDFAQARMYSNKLGRFTTPDEFFNDSDRHAPSSWNLYAYVRNNPLNATDPSGETIWVVTKNAKERQQVLDDLNYTYGCTGCVTLNSDNSLNVDVSQVTEAVQQAAQYLTDAINSPTYEAALFVKNGDSSVSFGLSVKGGATITDAKGNKRNIDSITIDFKDREALSGDKASLDAYIKLSIAHEVAHMSLGLKDPSPEDGANKTGDVVDKTNQIAHARGIPLRATYYGKQNESAQFMGYTYMGKVQIDKKTKVAKTDVNTKGLLVKSEKMVMWNLNMVKGIN